MSIKLGHSFFTSWLAGVGVDVVNNETAATAPPTEATFDTPEAR
jgi:hypothetical protein